MRLAIGDVVRDRNDQALGTVAGVATHPDGPLVAVQVNADLRLAEPEDLDVVARAAERALPGSGAVVQLGYAVAVLLGCAAANSARDIGGGWVLSILAGVGGAAAVLWPVRWSLRLLAPRRFRV